MRTSIMVGLFGGWLCAVAVGASSAGSPASDQPDLRTGAYTKAQAERGATVYSENCLRCHGEDMETARGGTEYGIPSPPIVGQSWLGHLTGKSRGARFTFSKTTMPQKVAAQLKAAA